MEILNPNEVDRIDWSRWSSTEKAKWADRVVQDTINELIPIWDRIDGLQGSEEEMVYVADAAASFAKKAKESTDVADAMAFANAAAERAAFVARRTIDLKLSTTNVLEIVKKIWRTDL